LRNAVAVGVVEVAHSSEQWKEPSGGRTVSRLVNLSIDCERLTTVELSRARPTLIAELHDILHLCCPARKPVRSQRYSSLCSLKGMPPSLERVHRVPSELLPRSQAYEENPLGCASQRIWRMTSASSLSRRRAETRARDAGQRHGAETQSRERAQRYSAGEVAADVALPDAGCGSCSLRCTHPEVDG
jgi:hypothetical protein